jgi:hypothetical protein
MSNIHSVKEAYETIAEALNYLIEHGEDLSLFDSDVTGPSARVIWDSKIKKFYVGDALNLGG